MKTEKEQSFNDKVDDRVYECDSKLVKEAFKAL